MGNWQIFGLRKEHLFSLSLDESYFHLKSHLFFFFLCLYKMVLVSKRWPSFYTSNWKQSNWHLYIDAKHISYFDRSICLSVTLVLVEHYSQQCVGRKHNFKKNKAIKWTASKGSAASLALHVKRDTDCGIEACLKWTDQLAKSAFNSGCNIDVLGHLTHSWKFLNLNKN